MLNGNFLQCKWQFKEVSTVTLVFTGPWKQPGDVARVKVSWITNWMWCNKIILLRERQNRKKKKDSYHSELYKQVICKVNASIGKASARGKEWASWDFLAERKVGAEAELFKYTRLLQNVMELTIFHVCFQQEKNW